MKLQYRDYPSALVRRFEKRVQEETELRKILENWKQDVSTNTEKPYF